MNSDANQRRAAPECLTCMVLSERVRVPGTRLVLPMSFMNASQPCREAQTPGEPLTSTLAAVTPSPSHWFQGPLLPCSAGAAGTTHGTQLAAHLQGQLRWPVPREAGIQHAVVEEDGVQVALQGEGRRADRRAVVWYCTPATHAAHLHAGVRAAPPPPPPSRYLHPTRQPPTRATHHAICNLQCHRYRPGRCAAPWPASSARRWGPPPAAAAPPQPAKVCTGHAGQRGQVLWVPAAVSRTGRWLL